MTEKNSAPAARPRQGPNAGVREAAGAGMGHYFAVNGLCLYYEVHGAGAGPPLVLLHGGWTTIGITFGALLPALATSRRVIAVEQQGHGSAAGGLADAGWQGGAAGAGLPWLATG